MTGLSRLWCDILHSVSDENNHHKAQRGPTKHVMLGDKLTTSALTPAAPADSEHQYQNVNRSTTEVRFYPYWLLYYKLFSVQG
jgi:hypothetical protein